MPWGQEDIKTPVPCHHTPVLLISSSFPQLEVLTNLANETNISTILREFQVCHGHTEAATLAWLLVPNHHHGGGRGDRLSRRSGLRPYQPHQWFQRAPMCDHCQGGCPALAHG